MKIVDTALAPYKGILEKTERNLNKLVKIAKKLHSLDWEHNYNKGSLIFVEKGDIEAFFGQEITFSRELSGGSGGYAENLIEITISDNPKIFVSSLDVFAAFSDKDIDDICQNVIRVAKKNYKAAKTS